MKRNVRKKIIVGIITMFLVLIYFTITNTSNAEDVIGTWDISADDGQSHVTATLYSDGNMIISGTGNMKNYEGSTYMPYSDNKENIKTVTIEKRVTNIGNYAFSYCRSLTSVEIPDSVTNIGNDAFYNCRSLTSVEIPDSVTNIGTDAFSDCRSLTSVEIPDSVTNIGTDAFSYCTSLTEINIPNSVTNIERGTFERCENLTNVIIPEGVTKIEEGVFSGCSNLRSISIPSSVTSIETINWNICSSCYSLTEINVDENNSNYTSVDGILFNKNKTEIVAYPPGKPDKIYKIPESVNKIGYCAFITSNLESIIIPKGVTRIERGAFLACTKLMNIEIPEGVTSIEYYAFFRCWNLKSIRLPNTLRYINASAFENCINLTSINLPENINYIWYNAFYGCRKLKNINIPEKVTNVDYLHDINLENVTISSNNNFIVENGVVFNKEKTKLIYYSREKIDKNYTIPNGVIEIYDEAFKECNNLTNINISEGVTSIGIEAFGKCKNLEEIIMPNSVTNIEEYAFYECTNLENIKISEKVTEIKKYVFAECSSLKNINLPDSITNIGDSAFYGCKSLTNINIPEGVTKIDGWAFYGCESLTNINIPEGVTTIGYNAFSKCIKLINIDIPESVVELDQSFENAIINIAFSNENNEIELPSIIKKAKIEGNILYADDIACYGCKINSDFTKIEVEGNMASIKINSGKLKGLTLNIYLSGKVLYSNCNDSKFYWTNKDVNAILLLAEGEQVINNNGSEIYTFTDNGEFTFIYRDINGETREVTAKVDKIDREKPTIENVHINPSEWTNGSVTISVDAVDNSGELYKYEFYSIYNGYRYSTKKEYEYDENTPYMKITASDAAGNVSDSVEIEISNIDNRKPIIHTIEGNVDNWTKEDVILRVNAEDYISGIKDYSFDGGVTWQTSNEKTYTENTQNIVIKVRDNAGNIVEHEPISITKIDKNKPTIRVDGNPNIWTNSDKKITITITDEESGIKKVKVNNNEVKINNEKIDILANENKTFEIISTDEAGNETKQTLVIDKIDKEKPTIEKVEGNPNNWTKGNVTLKVTAKDNLSGIKDYSFDGGTTWQTSNEKTYTENTQNIVIKVRDNAGNISEYEPISITKIMKLGKIEIRQQPEKTEYVEGENFNIAGMKVVAIYDNGTEEGITRYTIVNGNNLREGQESVTVRYKEGDITKEVIQKITVEKRLAPDVGDYEIIEDNGVKYIEKIKEGTSIKELKEKIKTNGTIEIYKGSNKVTGENEVIGTGMTIKVTLNNQEATYQAVVTGDLTGDGKIKMADLLKLARYKAGIDKDLSGAYLRAGDVVKNGKIGMPDILKLSRVLAGIENI